MTITRYKGSGTMLNKPVNQKYYLYQVPAGKIAKIKFNIYDELNTNTSYVDKNKDIIFINYVYIIPRLSNFISKGDNNIGTSLLFGINDIRLLGSFSSSSSFLRNFTFGIQKHPTKEDFIVTATEGLSTSSSSGTIDVATHPSTQLDGEEVIVSRAIATTRKNEFILTAGEGVWIYSNQALVAHSYAYDFTVIEEVL